MKDHFSASAERYASCRPGYPAALADWLAAAAPARTLAWDVGCGSGQMSVLLGDRFARVVGSDGSTAQLAHARRHARVAYGAMLAEAAALADGCADLIVAAQSAHWFDLPRFHDEVRRVARAGALVALIAYGNAVLDESALEDRFLRFYHDEIGAHWPPERQLIEDGYATLEFPFDEIAAPRIELRERWSADQMLGYIATWSALRGFERAGGDPRVLRDFEHELRRLWGPGAREVRWPMPIRAGRVR